jgi:hypothetical protein
VHAECNKKKPLGLSRFGDELNLTPKLGYFIFWKLRFSTGLSFYGVIFFLGLCGVFAFTVPPKKITPPTRPDFGFENSVNRAAKRVFPMGQSPHGDIFCR